MDPNRATPFERAVIWAIAITWLLVWVVILGFLVRTYTSVDCQPIDNKGGLPWHNRIYQSRIASHYITSASYPGEISGA